MHGSIVPSMHGNSAAPRPTRPRRVVILRVDDFERIMADRGLRTNVAIGRLLGIPHNTVSRLLRAENNPDPAFVGSVIQAGIDFADVFDLIDTETGRPIPPMPAEATS